MASNYTAGRYKSWDDNGNPLPTARLYTYVSGTTTQQSAFTDSTLTTPCTYSVDAGGGLYIAMNARGEAQVWVGSLVYTFTLKTSLGAVIETTNGVTDPGATLAAPGGAASIGFTPAGTGAVATTVQAKVRRYVDVFDFFTTAQITDVTTRAGTLNISTAVNAALLAAFTSGQKAIRFPAGEYFVGSHSTPDEFIFDLSTYGDDFEIITDGVVEFVCNTTIDIFPFFFRLKGNNRFKCGDIYFRDTNYNAVAQRGAVGFVIQNAAAADWGDISFGKVHSNNCVASFIVNGNSSFRVRNINIDAIYSYDCYYGYNGQNNGDNVHIGVIYSYQNYRQILVYGMSGLDAAVYAREGRTTSGAINISRLPGGRDTENIKVRYTARDVTTNTSIHVLINHIDLLGGAIKGIDIDVDIEGVSNYYPVKFVNYTGSGGSETAAASLNTVTDVRIKGTCDVAAFPVTTVASYASTGQALIDQTQYLYLDAATPAAFKFTYRRTYTPTWGSSGTLPVLGNASMAGEYSIDSGICHWAIKLTMGSTTTYGTGRWTFTLPVSCRFTGAPPLGIAKIFDVGTALYVGYIEPITGAYFEIYANNTANAVGPTIPMTWVSGDILQMSGSFPC